MTLDDKYKLGISSFSITSSFCKAVALLIFTFLRPSLTSSSSLSLSIESYDRSNFHYLWLFSHLFILSASSSRYSTIFSNLSGALHFNQLLRSLFLCFLPLLFFLNWFYVNVFVYARWAYFKQTEMTNQLTSINFTETNLLLTRFQSEIAPFLLVEH